MTKKLILALLAGLAVIAAVLGIAAGPAQATTAAPTVVLIPASATNGHHEQNISCTSGGSKFTATVYYDVGGIGTSDPNQAVITKVVHNSSPSALFDRFSLYAINDNRGHNDFLVYAEGGTVASQNDVTSAGSSGYIGLLYQFDNGYPGYFKLFVWGGVGNSADSCSNQDELV